MQQRVGAIQVQDPIAVVPRLLWHPRVGVHERREAAELQPANEQLGRAALHEAVTEIAADVVREVGDAGAGGAQRGDDQHPQRPEVRHLVTAPRQADGVLTGPPAAAEQDAGAGMDLVERTLQAVAVHPAQRPRRLRPGPAVGHADAVGDVVAVAVVGLDPLHAQLQHPLGRFAPPALGRRTGEVDHRPGPHPPLGHERLPVSFLDKVPRGRRRGEGGPLPPVLAARRGGARTPAGAGSARRVSRD